MSASNKPMNKSFNGIMTLLVIVSCLSKIFGFARDIVLTDLYGANAIADVYLVTLAIPDMLLDLLANTTMVGFVPIAVEKLREADGSVNIFTNSVIKLLVCIGVLFISLLMIFPSNVITLLAPGFGDEMMDTAVMFLRIISFTIFFRTVANIFNAYLNANKYFLPGAFIGIILDISVIGAIVLSKKKELLYCLPMGAVIGTFMQMIFLKPFAVKMGYKRMGNAPMWSDDIKRLLITIIPAAMSVGVMQISTVVNKALASDISVGGITMLNHASKISYFAENIVVSSIVTVLYPLLSEYYSRNEMKKVVFVIEDAIGKILTFLVPITAGLAYLSYPIIKILYGHGKFTESNVRTTAVLMMISVIGIVGIAMQTLLSRTLFAMKKIKISAIISASLICVYICLSILFSRIFGLNGIAMGTALSYTFGGTVYYVILKKICPEFRYKANLITLFKTVGCTAVMLSIMFLIERIVSLSIISLTVLLAVSGAVVYFATAQFVHLKNASIQSFLGILKREK